MIICALLRVLLVIFIIVGVFNTYFHYKPSNFFGATINSSYQMHFNGEMKCAYVKGWHDNRKCMCMLTQKDERLGNDKTLIASEPQACENDTDEIKPVD